MDTLRNESMIKLALDTIDLVILRMQVEGTSNKPVNRQEYYRLMRPRPAGRVQHGNGAALNRSTRELRA